MVILIGVWIVNPAQDLCAQGRRPAEKARVIKFDRKVPISERLIPGDSIVIVERPTFPPMIAIDPTETFDEALDNAILHDAIVVASGLSNGGILTERGTWILGRATGVMTKIIKTTAALNVGQRDVTFHHLNGELFIGGVQVRTGEPYPIFERESEYLLMLVTTSEGLFLSTAFRVGSNGRLAAVINSNGETDLPSTSALFGHSLPEVITGLRARLK